MRCKKQSVGVYIRLSYHDVKRNRRNNETRAKARVSNTLFSHSMEKSGIRVSCIAGEQGSQEAFCPLVTSNNETCSRDRHRLLTSEGSVLILGG
jgi:hypothetical protein